MQLAALGVARGGDGVPDLGHGPRVRLLAQVLVRLLAVPEGRRRRVVARDGPDPREAEPLVEADGIVRRLPVRGARSAQLTGGSRRGARARTWHTT